MAKSIRRGVKKSLKKLHVLTLFFMVVALVAGFALGALACGQVSKDDRFLLCGQTNTTLPLSADEGANYLYAEEGVEAVCFGRDVSDKVIVKTDLQKNADGQYIIPLDEEGVYTIAYTVDAPKFGEKAPNGPIERLRVFIVKAEG